MPFIRYSIGDRAAFGPKCSCGRGSHVLKKIEGRANDFLVLPSGSYIGTGICINIRKLKGILQYRVIQERKDLLCVEVVPDETGAPSETQIHDAIQSALPEPMNIEIEIVKRIPPGPKGKLCEFISKLKPEGEV